MPRRRPLAAAAVIAILVCGLALADQGTKRGSGALAVWPFKTLQLGMLDNENGAAALRASAPFGLQYHYLDGGVNTGDGWPSWATGNGSFVTGYVNESLANGLVPVFSYYELRQSLPGAKVSDEANADVENLHDVTTMKAYFANLALLFKLLGKVAAPTVIVHVEPDLWGYVEQSVGDVASREQADVASTGIPLLRGLPNNVSGFAQAIVRLRDKLAPHVLLAYQLSVFGTDKDLHTSGLTNPQTVAIGKRAADFYQSLHAHFDLLFGEYTNSDAGYQLTVLHQPNPFWAAADYARQVLFLGVVHQRLRMPIVLWQIPVGNTLYRTENNTPGHYQDDDVQWLLGDDSRAHLEEYAKVGVIALLFGSGIATGTCACDVRHDGITNPPPIDGNVLVSRSPDDDGGYLVQQAAAYYKTRGVRIQH